MSERGSLWKFLRRNRPRWFVQRSMRGLFDVMPAQDASFRGVTFGWKGIGVVDFDKRRGAK